MKLVWHYTNGLMIDQIIASGVIELATAGIETTEKAAAWFSTNPVWENSANRGNLYWDKEHTGDVAADQPVDMPLDKLKVEPFDPQMMEDGFKGRFRIGVVAEVAPHAWRTFKKLSGMSKEMAKAFESHENFEFGNPDEWRASFQPVPKKYWRTVERLVSGVWVPYMHLEERPASEVS